MTYYFAQTTIMPNNGASQAEDFQPRTRNPQTTGDGLQPGVSSQQVGGQNILDSNNSRLVVPSGDFQPQTASPSTPNGDINWVLILCVSAVIVVALEVLFRRRERQKPWQPVQAPIEPRNTDDKRPEGRSSRRKTTRHKAKSSR